MKLNQKGLAPIAIVIVLAILSAGIIYESTHPKKTSINSPKLTSLAIQSVPSPSPTPSPTPTLTPTPSPTLLPTPVPTSKPTTAPVLSVAPQPVANNIPPNSGYSYQTVSFDGQTFPVSIVAADLNSTKVIVDTASDSDCSNNCPVTSLADYVSRNGAYAGINGSFFCPAEYPSCAGKTNSFDTLLMNKNKHYFNSDNNVYSTIPAAIFSPGSARFVGRSLEWGRDNSPDSVIANYPLLVTGGNINFIEAPNEPKFGQKGPRGFIAARGNIVYIGVIRNATMGESAKVLHTLGMSEALNLDEGGSTALWSGGYKAGPGRNIPNAILFVNR